MTPVLRSLEISYYILTHHPKGHILLFLESSHFTFLSKFPSQNSKGKYLPLQPGAGSACLISCLLWGDKMLVPACCIFWCTGLALISTKSSIEFWIWNILEKNQKFSCIGEGMNQCVPLLWRQFVQQHLCEPYSMWHVHANYLCSHVSLGVLHPSSEKVPLVSGKGGPPQALSSHPVTLFRRALTAYKTFFLFPLQTWPWTFLKTSSL